MKKISALFLISLAFFLNACSKEEEIQNDFMFEEYHKGDKIVLNSVNGGSKTLIRTDKGFVVEGEEGKVLMFDFLALFAPHVKKKL